MKRSRAFAGTSQLHRRRQVLAQTAIVAALVTGGALTLTLGVHHYSKTPEEVLAIAPIDSTLCRVPGSGGWTATSVFFRIAQADNQPSEPAKPRTEVKPFDYAVEGTSPEPQTEPWLWDNLGTLSYRITTASADAQRYFDQGLRLAYAFNHNEALREGMPMLEGMWHYARGSAYAARGDVTSANAEVETLRHMINDTDFSAFNAWGVPARQVLTIAMHVVQARVAQSQGDRVQRSSTSAPRSDTRISFHTWSRCTGITLCASRSAQRCSPTAIWTAPRWRSVKVSRARRTMVGRCMD
jgi:hypothetical protein